MKALQLAEWKHEPEFREVDEPDPGPGELVIEVGGAGVCHSDLHLMYEFEPGLLPYELPFTRGHENAGWVHAVGAGVVLDLVGADATMLLAASVVRSLGHLTIVGIGGGMLPDEL